MHSLSNKTTELYALEGRTLWYMDYILIKLLFHKEEGENEGC